MHTLPISPNGLYFSQEPQELEEPPQLEEIQLHCGAPEEEQMAQMEEMQPPLDEPPEETCPKRGVGFPHGGMKPQPTCRTSEDHLHDHPVSELG